MVFSGFILGYIYLALIREYTTHACAKYNLFYILIILKSSNLIFEKTFIY